MDDEKLVRMANQMADFFRAYPAEQAAAGISEHIEQFWTPKMRGLFMDRIRANPDGIQPLVLQAFTRETPAASPILKETQGPDALGQMVSDAG